MPKMQILIELVVWLTKTGVKVPMNVNRIGVYFWAFVWIE